MSSSCAKNSETLTANGLPYEKEKSNSFTRSEFGNQGTNQGTRDWPQCHSATLPHCHQFWEPSAKSCQDVPDRDSWHILARLDIADWQRMAMSLSFPDTAWNRGPVPHPPGCSTIRFSLIAPTSRLSPALTSIAGLASFGVRTNPRLPCPNDSSNFCSGIKSSRANTPFTSVTICLP